MLLTITKAAGTIQLAVKTWLYPDSTIGVRLDAQNHRFLDRAAGGYSTISARIQTMNDLVELLLVTDALRRLDPGVPIRLYLPFFPYAQQDRVCVPGEALSVAVMANLINAQGYERVTVVDLHSEVAAALIHNLHHITQLHIIQQYDLLADHIARNQAVLVSPDGGASKKTSEIAKYFGHASFVRCEKRRNLATGDIVETLVYGDDDQIKGRHLLCCDDICVAGGTFLAIAAALKARGAASVALYTTHGIYSKGTGVLYAGGISKLFTTDSTFLVQPGGVEATILKLEDVFKVL